MSECSGENGDYRVSRTHAMPVRWARGLADLLTLSRLLGAILLASMPWEETVDALGKLVRYSLLLWITDAVDGRIARQSQLPPSVAWRTRYPD